MNNCVCVCICVYVCVCVLRCNVTKSDSQVKKEQTNVDLNRYRERWLSIALYTYCTCIHRFIYNYIILYTLDFVFSTNLYRYIIMMINNSIDSFFLIFVYNGARQAFACKKERDTERETCTHCNNIINTHLCWQQIWSIRLMTTWKIYKW